MASRAWNWGSSDAPIQVLGSSGLGEEMTRVMMVTGLRIRC